MFLKDIFLNKFYLDQTLPYSFISCQYILIKINTEVFYTVFERLFHLLLAKSGMSPEPLCFYNSSWNVVEESLISSMD